MPFSQSSQISAIVQTLEALQPRSLLDVGVGMGQYGFLARMNLEHLNLFDIQGNVGKLRPRSEWQIQIDGIEGFAAYLTPVHDYVYNQIFIGQAETILPTLPKHSYDLVIAIDILEHFYEVEGIVFLKALQRVAKKHVLISTPKTFIEQTVEANPLEDHRSFWTREALEAQGFTQVIENEDSWIMLYHCQMDSLSS